MAERLLVVDNYDSFTWNLVHYLIELGAEVEVVRNDVIGADEAVRGAVRGADGIVISPGPGTAEGAGVSLEVVAACAAGGVPLLGVCLGHQAIARAFGWRVDAKIPVMHGKTSAVTHGGEGVFEGLPSPFFAARYHSLVVVDEGRRDELTVTARSDDGTIMGLSHDHLPIHGVQFHPESIATEHGHRLLGNFIGLVRQGKSAAHNMNA